MPTESVKNRTKSAPKWFKKLKVSVGYMQDFVIAALLLSGYGDHSLVMLIARMGISNSLKAIEPFLSD